MRMALCWSSLLFLLFTSMIYVNASISLSPELTNFIPPCAQACFTSFLDFNFPASICGTSPTLQCLCSSSSTSDFTAGEGAIQCIISEAQIGFCQGADAQDVVATNAYVMCSGQVDAIPNTHKTLTATLIVQTTMPSIVFLAPPSKTISTVPVKSTTLRENSSSATATVKTSSITTTGTLTTASAGSTPVRTNTPTSTSTSTPTSVSSAPFPTEPAPEDAEIKPSLSKSQVVAIAASSVGGAAFLFGLIFIFACIRRRRNKARDSDMLPFQSDPSIPNIGFRTPLEISREISRTEKGPWRKLPPREPSNNGFRTPMEIRRELSAKARIPPIVPPRLETSDPYMFSRRSTKPDTIGLAISPERNTRMESVRSSRLLPEKPTLRLNNAAESSGGLKPRSQVQPELSRQSTATQFEEDDEEMSEYESYGRRPNEGFVGLAPAPSQTIRVVPPESKPPYFKNPNDSIYQAYGNTSPSLVVKPLTINRGVGSFSRPLHPEASGQNSQLQVPLRTTSRNPESRPLTASSSVYSSTSTLYNTAPSTGPLSGKPVALSIPTPPQSQPRQKRPPSQQDLIRASKDSMTSFDTVSSRDQENEPRNTIAMDLSPVVESPASAKGVSPVSYPNIRRLSQQLQQQKLIRMVPPPPQPDFASVFSSGLGSLDRRPENSNVSRKVSAVGRGEKPWQTAERVAAFQRQQLRLAPQNQNSQPRTPPQQTQPQPKLQSPFQPRPIQQPPSAQLHPRDFIAPSAYFNGSLRPSATKQSSLSRNGSLNSQNSTNSSLLAKRLGAEKAAALQLSTGAESERKGQQPKWRVLREEEKERARDKGWKPMLGRSRGGEEDIQREHVMDMGEREEGLPMTPGWLPKLTPTRRGDELFLSVA